MNFFFNLSITFEILHGKIMANNLYIVHRTGTNKFNAMISKVLRLLYKELQSSNLF